ncbi:hypothetical protein HYZ41_02730 [archaeon]|nr:hypothetical protein [archaeon]
MKTVYVAGNSLVKEDSIPLRIKDRLQEKFPEVEFKELEPTDNMPEEKTLKIIDTVLGIDKVMIITDIDKIVTGKIYSLHDFDLGFNLKLMKKTGKINGVRIIGIPAHMDEEQALREVSNIIKRI